MLSAPRWLAALGVAALGWAAPAQQSGPGAGGQARPWVRFDAPDGGVFILIHTGGTGLIHWTLATPCSPLEDQPGLEGLTRAVIEQSLFGTLELGSRDPAKEQSLAEGIVRRRGEFAQLYLRGVSPDPEDIDELERWQAELETLRDRGAYRRLLRSAPGQGPTLTMSESTALVQFATDMDGLRAVADLVHQRRESAALFGAGERFADNRFDQINKWKHDPTARVRSEVAALAFLDGPLRRLGLVPAIPRVVSTAAIRRAWENSQHPTRAVNVLVGDIDLEAAQQILSSTFAATDLPLPEVALPPLNQPRSQRQAVLDGASTAGVYLAMPVPRVRHAIAEACLRWLGEGDACALRQALADEGLRDFEVKVTYPFPDGLGHRANEGMVLLAVQTGATDPRAKDLGFLRRAVAKAVNGARSSAPPPPALAVFNATLSKEHNARKRDPAGLAAVIARTVLEGGSPAEVLAPWRPVSEGDCRAFLTAALSSAEQILVAWRPK